MGMQLICVGLSLLSVTSSQDCSQEQAERLLCSSLAVQPLFVLEPGSHYNALAGPDLASYP